MVLWEFLRFLWRGKWQIGACLVVALGIAILIITTAEPLYRAKAVLRIVSNNRLNSISGMPGGISGLASLAGFNLGGDDELGVALGTLKSHSFTADFIQDRNLMPVLFADRWDAAAKAWRGRAPTVTQAVDRFDRGGIRKIVEDRRTGFVVLQIEWKDPRVANQWLAGMVSGVNKMLREQKLREAAKSVAFLERQINQTQAIGVREAAYRLMEVQMKEMMIASTQEDYALKFVDAPIAQVAPQDRIWPRPFLILACAVMLGGMLGLLLAFVFHAQASPLVQARKARAGNNAAA
jgi:hypothetical protein